MSPNGTILANEKNYLTSRKKFFSCGDSRRGQSLVVWAIKEEGIALNPFTNI